jgi:hypothetical protein
MNLATPSWPVAVPIARQLKWLVPSLEDLQLSFHTGKHSNLVLLRMALDEWMTRSWLRHGALYSLATRDLNRFEFEQ